MKKYSRIKDKINGLIIVLGSPNSEKGELYSTGLERCQTAAEQYRLHPDYYFLLTGGFGAHFNTTSFPHAHYVKNCLIGLGIPESRFTEFAESRNTIEDAALSRPIVEKYAAKDLIIITSEFHLKRAEHVFRRVYAGFDGTTCFIPAKNPSDCDMQEIQRHEKEALCKLMERKHI